MKPRLSLLFLLLLITIAAGGLLVSQIWSRAIANEINAVIVALHGMGVVGLFALAGVQFLVAASGFLPASVLGMAAGAVYGPWLGFLAATCGVMAGAIASFALSRSVFRPFVARHLTKSARLEYIDRALARDSWRIVCLLRLSPVMPFAIASYTMGMSSVGFAAYCLGTLASLPALLLYVLMGNLVRTGIYSLASGAGIWRWTLLLIGALATIALAWRIRVVAMRAVDGS